MKNLFFASILFLYSTDVVVKDGVDLTTVEIAPEKDSVDYTKLDASCEVVYGAIKDLDIKHPEIVLAQARLETGNFKCKDCSYHYFQNAFGFKTSEYLDFDNWYESFVYYKKWQDKHYKGGDYYTFLKKIGYASAEHYNETVREIELEIRNGIKSGKY
jgi:hypothetical protein